MSPVRPIALPALLLLLLPVLASAADVAGVVRKTAGTVRVFRDGAAAPAAVGTKLYPSDTIETGADGAVGIILRDDSRVSLGPNSSLSVSRFLFAPAEGKLGFTARLTRGTLEYVSGLIGKLAPESVRFDTPVSSIGIRGTRFVISSDPEGGR